MSAMTKQTGRKAVPKADTSTLLSRWNAMAKRQQTEVKTLQATAPKLSQQQAVAKSQALQKKHVAQQAKLQNEWTKATAESQAGNAALMAKTLKGKKGKK